MSSRLGWEGVFGPGEEAVVDDVGEVAFEGAAVFARCRGFGDLAGEVGAGAGVDAGLGKGDAVEGGVDLAVAAAVEAVTTGGTARAAGDGSDAAVAGVGVLAAEA